MITYVCPGCGLSKQIQEAYAGKSAKCGKCGAKGTVPELAPIVTVPTSYQPRRSGSPILLVALTCLAIGGAAGFGGARFLHGEPTRPLTVAPEMAKVEPAPKPAEPPEVARFRQEALKIIPELRSYANLAVTSSDAELLRQKHATVQDMHSRLSEPPDGFAEHHKAILRIAGGIKLALMTYSVRVKTASLSEGNEMKKGIDAAIAILKSDVGTLKKETDSLEDFLTRGVKVN